MAEAQDTSRKIQLTVKTPKDEKTVEIEEDADVKDLKVVVAEAFGPNQEQLCLMFAGKNLRDADTLRSHCIKDGLTVDLEIKAPQTQADSNQLGDLDYRQLLELQEGILDYLKTDDFKRFMRKCRYVKPRNNDNRRNRNNRNFK